MRELVEAATAEVFAFVVMVSIAVTLLIRRPRKGDGSSASVGDTPTRERGTITHPTSTDADQGAIHD